MTPQEFDRELARHIGTFYADPLGFVMFCWPWGKKGTPLEQFPDGPDAWHRQHWEAMGRHIKHNLLRKDLGEDMAPWFSAVASGHGVGKSFEMAVTMHFLMSTRVDFRGIATANTQAQLETKTWPELSKWHSMAINSHWFQWTASTYSYKLYPEERRKNYSIMAQPWSEDRPEAFAGLHNAGSGVGMFFDEASAIPDKIFDVAEGAMTDGEGFFFCRGNPTRTNGKFYDAFHKDRNFWYTQSVDSRTVRITNKVYIARQIEKHGEDSDWVRTRVKGQFPRGSTTGFFSPELVDRAVSAELDKDHGAPLIMAVDVARFGDDKTIIKMRQGKDARSIPARKFEGLDTQQVADRVADAINQYQPDAVVIEHAGPGAGVIDKLKRMGHAVTELSPQVKAAGPEWSNKRAELHDRCRDWMDMGGCIEDDPDLIFDLQNIQYSFRDTDNALVIASKVKMKREGFPSPDNSDALVMTFAVNPPRRDAMTSRHRRRERPGRIAKNVDFLIT
jgi:hypothetical protein